MSNKIVIYTSPTCSPCRNLKPILFDRSKERGFKLEIIELSEETRPKFIEKGIRAVPVTILVDENECEIGRVNGGMSLSKLKEQLEAWDL